MSEEQVSYTLAKQIVASAQRADAALDADAFVALLAEDVAFRIGSTPELQGRVAVRQAISKLFSAMNHVDHTTHELVILRDRIFLWAEVRFEPKSAPPITLQYVNVLKVGPNNLLLQYFIHIDLMPIAAILA